MAYNNPTAGAAREALNAGTVTLATTELNALAAAIPTAAVANIAATTNITAVPGSFADEAAVQAYLAGANVIPNIETRLDNLEAKVNDLLAKLRTGGIITP